MSTPTNTAPEVKPAISSKLAKATTPPPRKAEIIEAMAIRKHKQLHEEAERNRIECNKIEAEMRAIATKHLKEVGDWTDRPYISTTFNEGCRDVCHLSINVSTGKIPPELNRLQRKLNKLRDVRCVTPSLNDVKRQIRDAMAGNTAPGERVSAILADPEASRAIDKLLAELERPKVAALPAAKETAAHV